LYRKRKGKKVPIKGKKEKKEGTQYYAIKREIKKPYKRNPKSRNNLS